MSLCTKHAAFLMRFEAPSPFASMLAAIMRESRCPSCEIDAAKRAAYLAGVRAGLEAAAKSADARYICPCGDDVSGNIRALDPEAIAKEAKTSETE